MDGDGTTTPVAGRASAVGVYDPSNARDALRFVSEMLQAGTGEEVVQQVLLSDQRDQWSALLRTIGAATYRRPCPSWPWISSKNDYLEKIAAANDVRVSDLVTDSGSD